MTPDVGITGVIVQSGGIGLAALLIWVIWRLVSNHDEHLQSVVNRNTDAWIENAKALTRLTDSLDNRRGRK